MKQTNKKSELEHNEHATITFSKGIWEVTEQREFDVAEGIRKVAD